MGRGGWWSLSYCSNRIGGNCWDESQLLRTIYYIVQLYYVYEEKGSRIGGGRGGGGWWGEVENARASGKDKTEHGQIKGNGVCAWDWLGYWEVDRGNPRYGDWRGQRANKCRRRTTTVVIVARAGSSHSGDDIINIATSKGDGQIAWREKWSIGCMCTRVC